MYARLATLLTAALLTLLTAGASAADEARFDVAVTDAPARAFFEGLAEGTPYNIVLEPGVGGTLSIKLKSVTVPEVLEAVREAYGYDFRRIASGFIVVPPTLQTRIYQVNYIDIERRGTSRTNVSSGGPSQNPQSQQPQGGAGGAPSASGGAPDALSEPPGGIFRRAVDRGNDKVKEITGSSVSTRTASDFWHDVEVSLRSLIGTEGGRQVIVNTGSGVVVVRAAPRELRDVQQFLDRLQEAAVRQVLIEAKIIEVELASGLQAGINWAAIARRGSQTFNGFQTEPPQGWNTVNLQNNPGSPVTLTPGTNPLGSTVTNPLLGAFSLAINATDFSAFIDLLATQGKTRVLSSPRVSTLNNQKAVIKAGSDEYFVTGVSSNTVVGTASATNSDVTLTPFFSGVALDVLPQISADGSVLLHIHPTISDVTSKVTNLTVAGQGNSLPLALSQIRESDSVVKAKSGQIIVIGGLMRTTYSNQNYRMPLLGDIPVLGNLFKSQQRSEVHSELVILLRPVVVDSDGDWQKLTTDSVSAATALDPKANAGAH